MTFETSGLWVALATPFTARGELDIAALKRLVRHVVDGGVDVIVPLGTTGEAVTLTDQERDAVILAALSEARGRPVVAGCGHNATRQAAVWTRRARDLGAQGALIVTPYYNRPGDAGLIAHYAAIADAAPGFPIVAYNVPSRTGVTLSLAALEGIWRIPALVALKESGAALARFRDIAETLPAGKTLLVGDDHSAVAGIAAGARGLVSVAANIAPREMSQLVQAALARDEATARGLQARLAPLFEALFLESNPIPLKAALALAGLAEPFVRLPLTMARTETVDRLRHVLQELTGGPAEASASS